MEPKPPSPAAEELGASPSEQLERPSVPAIDAILGQPFNVLDQGFVRVIDYMGSDAAIVQAARISYGKGTKSVHDDRGLIRYLLRHEHTTPFEMCEIKLHVRVPMDCWRQWIRHRTASVNEYSTRYSEAIDAAQVTPLDAWRTQAAGNRQGSGDALPAETGAQLSDRERELHALAREVYAERLAAGVAREQARKDLPLSTYTEAYWKTDLHNLLRFLRLRMAPQAQQEIRAYASVIGEQIVSRWCPVAWEAFRDYQLTALTLSAIDIAVIAHIAAGRPAEASAVLTARGMLERNATGKLRVNRERAELEAKLAQLGFEAPWREP